MSEAKGGGAEEPAFDPFAGPALALAVPSTEAQREVWTASQLGAEASCAFNESFSLDLRGPLDVPALGRALSGLVARHEALRATFSADGASYCVTEPSPVPLQLLDLSGAPPEERRAGLDALVGEEVSAPFDLERGPLVRYRLVRLGPDDHVLVQTAHHIVCDGYSTGILLRDLAALYGAEHGGRPSDLPPATPFSSYATRAAALLTEASHADDERFWTKLFTPVPDPLELPLDRARPRVRSFSSDRIDHRLPSERAKGLRTTGAPARASSFAVMLAAFAALLRRLSGQDEVVVAIPTAGQVAAGMTDVVGHCVNTLPVRLRVDADEPFSSLLARVRSALLDAQEHQEYTLGSLLRALAIPRDPGRLPLASVLFNLDQGLPEGALRFDGLQVTFHSNPRRFENFDLFANAVEVDGEIVLECQYGTDLLEPATVRRWGVALEHVLAHVEGAPGTSVGRIPLVGAEDRALLQSVNGTAADYPRNQLLHQLVEEQVDRTPDAVALRHARGEVTFAELDRRANRLAHLLVERGAGPDVLVGLYLDRSDEMLVALLAVHKVGAAYVPLDPAFPAERLAFMVADSGMRIVLTRGELRATMPPGATEVVDLDADAAAITARPDARLPPRGRPDALAYLLYTSGSTGKPKGVEVPVAAVVNFLWSVRREPGLTSADRLLAVTTLSFDIAVLELWLPLVVGARITLATREQAMDGGELRSLLESSGATVMQATPATWRVLLGAGWTGAPGFKAICGGEALPVDLSRQLAPRTELWNMYGPTETTVWSTCYRVPAGGEPVLIGKPLANTQVHVLDVTLQPVPVGVPGELFIGGDGVARGYWNRPELTADRFLPNPFRPGSRLYRTGDVVRLRNDGNLLFVGRNDGQVKLRGFRIELGEVEAALARHPAVTQAVVMVREDRPGDARLVAYVAQRRDVAAQEEQLRRHVRGILPEYMVPQHVMHVEAFPLTPNGKVDRKALPAPDASREAETPFVPPRTEAERVVAALWQEALGISRIGVHDDFFALGGHSLLAAQVISRLGRLHGIHLPLRTLFQAPTVAAFAAAMSGGPEAPPVPHLPDDGPAPASIMQERIWGLEQLQPGRAIFNLPSAFRLRGPLDVAAFREAFEAFLQRHEAARTTLRGEGAGVVQEIGPAPLVTLEVEDLRSVDPASRESELGRLLLAESAIPFDLGRGPLWRLRLFRTGDAEHVVFFMPHHAIWDGWSFDVLLREWAEGYAARRSGRAPALEPLPVRYRDFAAWHREWLRSPDVERQAAWWRERLSGEIPSLALPTDRPRPRTVSDAGSTLWVEISRAEADALTELAHRSGTTLFVVMLAAWTMLLHRLAGQEEVLVGMPVRGRNRPELEGLAGTFVNTLVLRSSFAGDPTFNELLARIRTTVVDAFAHEDVPFELLAMNRKPAYRALFSFQDTRGRPSRFGDLSIGQVHVLPPVAANDVSLWVMESNAGLVGGFNFSTDLFDPATAERFLARFRMLLRGALAEPDRPVSSITMSADGDRSVTGGGAPPEPSPGIVALVDGTASPEVTDVGSGKVPRAELLAGVAALRSAMQAGGVVAGDAVAALLGPSAEGVEALLAAASLRAPLVAIDPEAPAPRVDRLLAEASPRMVVGGAAAPSGSGSPSTPGWDALAAAVAGAVASARPSSTDVHLVAASADERWVTPALLALASGGSLVVDAEPDVDPERLVDLQTQHGVTVLCATPSVWQGLVAAGWSGGPSFRAFCVGAASPDLARELVARAGHAFSVLSLSDGTWVGLSRLERDPTVVALAGPLPGFTLSVVDDAGRVVSRGVPGRLVASGPGLPGDTEVAGRRARMRIDGHLEPVEEGESRIRIGPWDFDATEVEQVLLEHPGVAAAAVGVRRDAIGEDRLVAWYVSETGVATTGSELRSHLRDRVSFHMVPGMIVEVDRIPGDGIPARRELPSPFAGASDGARAAPSTASERLVARVWAEALEGVAVGLHDNFFDLGGHSLLCLQVVARIERETGRRLSPRLFLLNTLQQIAAQLPGRSGDAGGG